ncbi:hypothetical protein ACQKGO_36210 [Corallococcus interemptor]|uniref:hypothetical protein n=1 Tax=Corallococcus interemptor TaxID=2316720 RepID=UPI003CFEC4D8
MPLDLEAFHKTQRYQARSTAPEVLEDLRKLAEPPPKPPLTPSQTVARVGAWLLGAGVLGLVIFGIVLDRPPVPLMVLFIAMAPVGFVMFVVGNVMSPPGPAWPRHVEPHVAQRRQLVATLLKRLQVDLEQDAPVEVSLDLTNALRDHKRVHLENEGNRTRQDFSDPWLSLQGRFADGTQLHLTVVDQVRTLQRTKLSASGRLKSKARRHGVSLMTVALRVKPERHPALADLEAHARGAVRLPPGASLKRLRVAEDRAELRVLMDEDWVAQAPRSPNPPEVRQGGAPRSREPVKADASRTATMMLLSLYQVLNHSSSQGQPGKMRSTP